MMSRWCQKLWQPFGVLRQLTPTWVAFLSSAALSMIAITTSTTLNRDGMLYVDTARVFLKYGLSEAISAFAWPFLSILMAMVSHFTGLGIENSGHLLNVLFMAGACALLVACSAKIYPESGWAICLTLLAIPGLNDYRNELLREYGCWFFIMLSFWLALRWAEMPTWRMGILAQASLVLASLFRPEALVFLPGLILWQVFETKQDQRVRRLAMIGSLSLIALIVFATLFATGLLPKRLVADFSRINSEHFKSTAKSIMPALTDYSRENVNTILFFGSMAIIPVKFIKMMGVFSLPLLYSMTRSSGLCSTLARLRVFTWAFIVYLAVLSIFVLDNQFLAGRYVVLLLILATPATGRGMYLVLSKFPHWKVILISLAVLMSLSNVVSTAPGKQHFVDAGRWLAENVAESPRVYNESARSAYYAGWRYYANASAEDRKKLQEAGFRQQYDFVVLEASRKIPLFPMWLDAVGLREVKRFTHPNGDAVIILVPVQTHVSH